MLFSSRYAVYAARNFMNTVPYAAKFSSKIFQISIRTDKGCTTYNVHCQDPKESSSLSFWANVKMSKFLEEIGLMEEPVTISYENFVGQNDDPNEF